MISLWISLFLAAWFTAGCVRFIMLMGYKNHKLSLLDNILILAVFPLAYLLGFITYLSEKVFDK